MPPYLKIFEGKEEDRRLRLGPCRARDVLHLPLSVAGRNPRVRVGGVQDLQWRV